MNAILAAQQRIRDLETDPLSGSDSDGGGGLGFGAETAVTSQDVAKYRRGSGNGEPLMVTPEARMEAFNRFQHMLRQHPAIQQAIEEEHRMLVTRFLFVEELVQVRIPAPPSAFCNDPMLLMHSCVCVCVCVYVCRLQEDVLALHAQSDAPGNAMGGAFDDGMDAFGDPQGGSFRQSLTRTRSRRVTPVLLTGDEPNMLAGPPNAEAASTPKKKKTGGLSTFLSRREPSVEQRLTALQDMDSARNSAEGLGGGVGARPSLRLSMAPRHNSMRRTTTWAINHLFSELSKAFTPERWQTVTITFEFLVGRLTRYGQESRTKDPSGLTLILRLMRVR